MWYDIHYGYHFNKLSYTSLVLTSISLWYVHFCVPKMTKLFKYDVVTLILSSSKISLVCGINDKTTDVIKDRIEKK